MPNCKHTYREHGEGLAAFCKANPDRWYPIAMTGCLGALVLAAVGFIAFVMWLF